MCRPKGWGFRAVLVWKWVQTLLILVWSRVWFSRELRERRNLFTVSIPNELRKKEKYASSKCVLRNLFCCCSNLSNDDIISGQVWEWVWILEARSEKGCEKWHFWSEIWSGFGEPGGTPPPRIPRSSPLPPEVSSTHHTPQSEAE